MRGSRALVTLPKVLLLMSPAGLLNCAWLKILKNSPRISKCIASLSGIIFDMPKSVLLNPGPWKNRRFAVPKVPQSGLGVVPVKKQFVGANELWLKYVYAPVLSVARGLEM